MILSLFRRKPPDPSIALYDAIVAAARQPALYLGLGVADTVEGRFEMLVLHMALAMGRLNGLPIGEGDAPPAPAGTPARSPLAQALVDRFFLELDRAIREMGIGDVAVPKRMKKLAGAYNGRLIAYISALAQADEAALTAALARNVWPSPGNDAGSASALASYVKAAHAALASTSDQHMAEGKLSWPDPAGFA